ncbi:MAG: hypothetical protein ACRDDY_03780 [Clostridium sp.]
MKEKKLEELYIREHSQHMITAILSQLNKSKLIDDKATLLASKEDLVEYLSKLYEDVSKNVQSGNGKQEFVSAMLQVANHYGVIDMVAELCREEIEQENEVEIVE